MKTEFILRDSFLSIVSKILLIGTIQFVIFPQLLEQIGDVMFGEIVTYVAILNMVSMTFGNVLNNMYLILSKDHALIPLKRNISFIFIWSLMINLVLVFGFIYSSNLRPEVLELALILCASGLLLYNTFWTVNYRLELDYVSALKDSLIVSVGYMFGYVLFLLTDLWILIYVSGFLFGLVYVTFKHGLPELMHASYNNLRGILPQYSWLLISGLLLSLGTYIDKIILFPRMGGEVVGYYFVASLMPKSIGMIVGPVAGVLLSYLVKTSHISRRSFVRILLISLILASFAYLVIIAIDSIVLNHFYPDLAEISLQYTPIISMGILLLIISNVLNTTILTSKNLMYQIVINGVYLITYVIASLNLLEFYGLKGFSFAIAVAATVKLAVVIFIFYKAKETSV